MKPAPVLDDHLTESEVTELRALVRKLLARAWQDARAPRSDYLTVAR